jgi:hypothetical protein
MGPGKAGNAAIPGTTTLACSRWAATQTQPEGLTPTR